MKKWEIATTAAGSAAGLAGLLFAALVIYTNAALDAMSFPPAPRRGLFAKGKKSPVKA